MQHKWMVLLTALILFSVMIAPVGPVQAQADRQDTAPNCPPYEPGLLEEKELLRSLPRECLKTYKEFARQANLTSNARDAQPTATGGPDDFGYTYDDAAAYSWISATTNSGLTGDDEFTGPINIGFNFPFYGVPQSQLYFSTNGLITFGKGNSQWGGYGIPTDTDPNNFIAPFWGDLQVGNPYNSGAIYYSQGGTAPNRYFLVEWRNVMQYGGDQIFSFEAILYENGDILFQYQSLPFSYYPSVGLEDSTGYDGLNYMYWELSPSKAIHFDYPATAARVLVSPALSAGGFAPLSGHKDFSVSITNSGALGTDTYDLNLSSTWSATLYASNGVTPLTDTDGDTVIDTGIIPQGTSITIIAKFHTPAGVQIGDKNTGFLTITSSLAGSTSKTIRLSMSVPADFVNIFQDTADGAMSVMAVDQNEVSMYKATADDQFGYGVSVARLANGNYFYVWGTGYANENKWWRDIEYALFSGNGSIVVPLKKLTNNESITTYTEDRNPSVAVAPNGMLGIVWSRRLYNPSTDQFNYNVYFATLDTSGNILTGPTNITNNAAWGTYEDPGVPRFTVPTIAASTDNRFIIGWEDEQEGIFGGLVSDIWYAVRSTAGTSVFPPTALTSYGGSTKPILNSLTNGKVIMTWVEVGLGPYYGVISSNGSIAIYPEELLSYEDYCVYCGSPDAVQLPNGKVAIASATLSGVELTILDSTFMHAIGPTFAPNPFHPISNMGESISVTTDDSSRVIMTWTGPTNRLLYALGDSNGTFITSPIIYYMSGDYIDVSYNGQGNAPFSTEIDTTATFSDVRADYWAWQFVERLVNAGITAGCGGGLYCPESTVTRAQMAVFLLRGMHGSSYSPPAVGASTGFGDVQSNHWAGAWVKQLAAEGITGGCGNSNYCPESPVTRAQMAVFLLRSKYGPSYSPPAVGGGTGFGDVQSTHWAGAWIKQLVAEGITAGCGSGNYCPESPVTRAQMAVFLVKTFNLP